MAPRPRWESEVGCCLGRPLPAAWPSSRGSEPSNSLQAAAGHWEGAEERLCVVRCWGGWPPLGTEFAKLSGPRQWKEPSVSCVSGAVTPWMPFI